MPQMAPLNWLTLYFFFVIILVLFNILNFYSFNYIIKIQNKTKKILNFNWKW
uniref:ATP synthase complex subunit 8 n=1 Tax=Apriona germarii TaxID=157307 RepID=A0A8F0WPE9_APRGE|nr:ATP synthase F0 subunit 8 [Apriona germarii]QWM97262.1 ATP synthase F0 subunit 8 [Apriona germarii]